MRLAGPALALQGTGALSAPDESHWVGACSLCRRSGAGGFIVGMVAAAGPEWTAFVCDKENRVEGWRVRTFLVSQTLSADLSSQMLF